MILVSRAEWGSRATKVPVAADPEPEVYVHHVAGRTPTGADDEAKHMRELQVYAIEVKGYIDMDYNVLIGTSGRAYEGRGYFGRSAATKDRNEASRAICLMGNLDLREPTAAQLETLPLVIADMVAKGSLTRDVVIRGHFENPAHPNATICPGRFMIPHLPAVRSRVAELLQPPTPTPQPPTEDTDMPPELIRFLGFWNEVLDTQAGPIHGTVEQVQRWRPAYGVTAPPNTPPGLVTASKMALVIDPAAQTAKFRSTLHRLGLTVGDLTRSDEDLPAGFVS